MLILFDFDGTLADTAPDMALVANLQRTRRNLPPLEAKYYRPHASKGVRGMLQVALEMSPDHPEFDAVRDAYFNDYEQHMTGQAQLFPGIAELLHTLNTQGHAWGIVTNKMERFAYPLVAHLGLAQSCAATVCGDTTAHAKPHPAPLLHAAQLAGYPPVQCVYVGDDERDIIAGRSAGMPTVAAAYGYCEPASISTWGADAVAHDVQELGAILQSMLPSTASSG